MCVTEIHVVLQDSQFCDFHCFLEIHEVGDEGLDDEGDDTVLEVVGDGSVLDEGYFVIDEGNAVDKVIK